MSVNTEATKEKYYPTNDYLFKRLFGYKGNESITQSLIEAILDRKCKVLEVKSNEATEMDLIDDKIGILDVFVTEADGTQVNIEMQVAEYEFIIERMMFYWGKKYIENMKKGDTYQELKSTKVILITDYELDILSEVKEVLNLFKIIDTKTGKIVLTECLEIAIIELPKLGKYKIENKNLESWLKFIKNPESIEEGEMEENRELKKAKEEYDKIMADEHEKELIEARERRILDLNSIAYENKKKYEQAIKDGLEERKERTEGKNGREERT